MNGFYRFSQKSKKGSPAGSLLSVFILLFVMLSGIASAADEKFTVRYDGNGAESGHISEEYLQEAEV